LVEKLKWWRDKMRLFIDTANKKIIFAIINDKNEIIDFFIKDTNNDVAKTSIFLLEKFIAKNKISFEDIDGYMLTIGPGSFTGVKVGLNIVRTIDLLYPVQKIYTIDNFDLLKEKDKKYTAIRFGKNKFYFLNKKSTLSKPKIITSLKEYKKTEVTLGYDNFSKEKLKEKIYDNSFKFVDNLSKVKLKYLNKF